MTNITSGFMMAAPGKERPDYTLISFPAANLTDGSSEEIELDQALSLAGRFGRDLLGVQIRGLLGTAATEWLSVGGADHEVTNQVRLATRTGTFSLSDPELLYVQHLVALQATVGTDAGPSLFLPHFEELTYGEPELYVAPRLFWRETNNMDATISADTLDARVSSMSRRLTFNLFVELLERFADVTLL